MGTLTGALGGLAGSVVPGVGTVAGAAAGSALGGAATEAFLQKRERKREPGRVVGEAAFGAAGPLLGGAFRGLKAATAAKAGITQPFIQSFSQSMKAGVVNPKVAPTSVFASWNRKQIVDGIDEAGRLAGIKVGGAAAQRQDQNARIMKALGVQIKEELAGNPRDIPIYGEGGVISNFIDRIGQSLHITGNAEGVDEVIYKVGEKIQRAAKNGRISSATLFPIGQEVGEQMSKIYTSLEKGGAIPDKKNALVIIRDTIAEAVGKANPQVAQRTKLQSLLFDAAEGLETSATGTIPLLGTNLPIKRGVQQIGELIRGTLEKITLEDIPLAREGLNRLVEQLGVRGGAALFFPSGSSLATTTAPIIGATGDKEFDTNLTKVFSSMKQLGQQPSLSQPVSGLESQIFGSGLEGGLAGTKTEEPLISQEEITAAMLLDLKETGGKHINELKTIYETANKKKAGGIDLSVNQQRDIAKIQTARSVLKSAANLVSSMNPAQSGIGQRIKGVGLNIQGAVGENKVVQAYNEMRTPLAITLIKAMGEAGQLAKFDIKTAEALLPGFGSTMGEIEVKLATINSIFDQEVDNIIESSKLGGKTEVPEPLIGTAYEE
ncbi:MAG: hypothetical protein QME66_04345 [Candidatus Eisenbacteria bacterium]|nr:hypothetical protein [Candidatus Eisenbacteria bacterium]